MPEARIRALGEPWKDHPRGSLVIDDVDPEVLDEACARLHLDAVRIRRPPDVALLNLRLPRIALFHSWSYTQDSGWVRYTFEELGIAYTLIDKGELRLGALRDRFDVIVVPSQGRLDLVGMIHGIDSKWGPMPYTRTHEYASHGVVDSSEDITGGMGFVGLAHLHDFVRGAEHRLPVCPCTPAHSTAINKCMAEDTIIVRVAGLVLITGTNYLNG